MAAFAVRRRRLLWKPLTRSLLGAYINSVITTHKTISAPKPAEMQLQPASMRIVGRQSGRVYTAQCACALSLPFKGAMLAKVVSRCNACKAVCHT